MAAAKKTLADLQELREVPFESLYVAPENARFDKVVEDLPAIAASIDRYGLLQPLVVYEGERHEEGGQSYAVTNGRRRLAGIGEVRKSKRAKFKTVQVRVVPRADAAAIALAGEMHVELSAADQARQWTRMTIAGEAPEQLAKAFGVTERFVQQRLRLGSLHEPILDALDAGQISVEIAQLYAGALMARQESVWRAIGPKARAHQVRDALAQNTIRAGEPLALFVGEAAYTEAGGRIEQELFLAPEDSRWLDIEIAERIGEAKLEEARARVANEEPGWSFIELRREFDAFEFTDGNLGKQRKPDAGEKKARTRIEQRLREIQKRQDEIDKLGGGDDVDWSAIDDETDRLGDEARALELERDALDASLRVIAEGDRGKGGVVLSLSPSGQLTIRRGLVKPKASKAKPGNTTKAGGGKAAAASPEPREPDAGDMSNATHERCTRIAGRILADALTRKPDVALVVITAQLARIIFADEISRSDAKRESGGDLLLIREQHQSRGADIPALACDDDAKRDRQHWSLTLAKHWPRLEMEIADWSDQDQKRLLAFCVGQLFTTLETNVTLPDDDDVKAKRQRTSFIGRMALAEPGAIFTPQLEFLKGFSKPALAAAAAELGIEVAASASRAQAAAQIADAAAPKQWTPPLIREIVGATFATPIEAAARGKAKPIKPARATPKKAAKKKPAKKIAKKAAKKSPAKKSAKQA